MAQLSKTKSILYHLYPGILITAGYIILNRWLAAYHLPGQLCILLAILIIAIPVFISHLLKIKRKEKLHNISELNIYTKKLSTLKLILYSAGLVLLSFIIWSFTQPVNQIISEKIFSWLPDWYYINDFKGYGKEIIWITLLLNLVLNGLLGPFFEEVYFRGYLLPRMTSWGKWAFVVNAVLFSLYHFWQPTIYLTLILSLLPMTWLVWKTRDLRLAILTHVMMNIIGAILSFGLLQ